MRDLSGEEMDAYRAPFLNAGEDRRPTLTWPTPDFLWVMSRKRLRDRRRVWRVHERRGVSEVIYSR